MAFRELSFNEIDKVAGGYWNSYYYYSSDQQIWDREWIDDVPVSGGPGNQDNGGEWVGPPADANVLGTVAALFDHARDVANAPDISNPGYDSTSRDFWGSFYGNYNASDFFYHLADYVPFDATVFSPYSNGGSYSAGHSTVDEGGYVANMSTGGNYGTLSYNGIEYSAVYHNIIPARDPQDPADSIYVNGNYWTIHPIGFTQDNLLYQEKDQYSDQSGVVHLIPITQDWGHAQYIQDPVTGDYVRAATGALLQWPSGVNPVDIYNRGLETSSFDAMTVLDPMLFRQNGVYDFQRSGSHNGQINHPEFIDAATVAIGIFNAAAGVPMNAILAEQDAYAAVNSRYASGTLMDTTYTHLPARNVANTVIGYELANHISQRR